MARIALGSEEIAMKKIWKNRHWIADRNMEISHKKISRSL
jgi:hypothetical protein